MGGARKLVPLLDRLLVRKVEVATKSKGGILLPDSGKAKALEGVVVAAGPGGRSPTDGSVVPMTVKAGDTVVLPEWGSATKIEHDGEELFVYRESDIVGVYK